MLFWDVYAYIRYANFVSTYFDIGLADYNLYYYATQHISALQFFVFMNHLSFFFPIVFAFYKLVGNPFSFIWLQNFFMAFTAPIIYMIGRLREKRVGFAFAIAYLINPALWGLGVFDAHLEGILPFFYMLSLYLYLKKSGFFVISFILLLSIIDTGAALALFFAIGLIIYELLKRKNSDKKMLKLLFASLLIAIIFIAAYWLLSISIKADVPPQLKVMNFFGEQQNVLAKPTTNAIGIAALFWLAMGFFSFGITSIFALLPSIFFLAPWLAEIFVVRNILFITPYMQYFAYAIGGLAGALLGSQTTRLNPKLIEVNVYFFAILFLISFIILYHFPSPFGNAKVANIDIVANSLNTSIMAQGSITPHLYNMLYVENPPDEKPMWFEKLNYTTFWFKPEYIIIDRNLSDYLPMNSSEFNVYAYMRNNYTPYLSENGLEIYKKV